MTVEMLKGKIHRATVVQAELDYVGSITVDEDLLEAAGIMEYEKVQIVDVNNGSRFETYTICGKRGSGMCRVYKIRYNNDIIFFATSLDQTCVSFVQESHCRYKTDCFSFSFPVFN